MTSDGNTRAETSHADDGSWDDARRRRDVGHRFDRHAGSRRSGPTHCRIGEILILSMTGFVRFVDILSMDSIDCGLDGQRCALPTIPQPPQQHMASTDSRKNETDRAVRLRLKWHHSYRAAQGRRARHRNGHPHQGRAADGLSLSGQLAAARRARRPAPALTAGAACPDQTPSSANSHAEQIPTQTAQSRHTHPCPNAAAPHQPHQPRE